jgi:hypothetical protein
MYYISMNKPKTTITPLFQLILNQELQLARSDVAEGCLVYDLSGLKPLLVHFKRWHTSRVRAYARAAFRFVIFRG